MNLVRAPRSMCVNGGGARKLPPGPSLRHLALSPVPLGVPGQVHEFMGSGMGAWAGRRMGEGQAGAVEAEPVLALHSPFFVTETLAPSAPHTQKALSILRPSQHTPSGGRRGAWGLATTIP